MGTTIRATVPRQSYRNMDLASIRAPALPMTRWRMDAVTTRAMDPAKTQATDPIGSMTTIRATVPRQSYRNMDLASIRAPALPMTRWRMDAVTTRAMDPAKTRATDPIGSMTTIRA